MFKIKVKKARLDSNLTQEELSHMTSISQSYLSKIENNNFSRNKSSCVNKILTIAKSLDCCPLTLMEVHCSNCIIKTDFDSRAKCRQNMIDKGYNPNILILK